jgi:hypothetical protein
MPRSVNFTVLYIYDYLWSFFPFSQISLGFVALIEYIYYTRTEPILTIFSVSSEDIQNSCFNKNGITCDAARYCCRV